MTAPATAAASAASAAGQSLEYWRVPGRDHHGVVAPDSPITNPLIAWTTDRVDGKPQVTGCASKELA